MFACFLKVAELFLKPNTEIFIWPASATVSVLCRGTHFCRIASTLRSGLLYSVGWGSMYSVGQVSWSVSFFHVAVRGPFPLGNSFAHC